MALSDLAWRFVPEETRDGATQMALDEIAAETAAAGGPATVRVYRWQPGTISLGYAQDATVLDREYCDRNGLDVTRRQTGGGTIYHDAWGDISYSIALPAEAVPGDLMESYHLLCAPLFSAFERLGIDARYVEGERPAVFEPACYLRGLHPAHDVVGPDGRKLSGNAQYRQREAVVQHGSITFERATDAHLSVFDDCDVTPEEFRERVGAMTDYAECFRSEAVDAIEDALREWCGGDVGSWTDDELAAARERAREKFDSKTWVEERTDPT
ncbi:MAG: biotin/lipoate A/B protein ligase family protein [Halapricum sp.]